MMIRLLVILLFYTFALNAGDRWQVKTGFESGLYVESISNQQLQSGFSAKVQYAAKIHSTLLRLKTRMVPRYFFSDKLSSMKFSSTMDISRTFGIGIFNIQALFHKNWFDGELISRVSYNLFQTQLHYIRYLGKKTSVQAQAEFYVRDFTSGSFNTMKAFISKVGLVHDISGKMNIGMGVCREDYSISADVTTTAGRKNPGIRFGPELSMRLRTHYIATISFFYNIHSSGLSKSSDEDYRFVLLAGKYLSRNVSVFIYANYYKGSASGNIPIQLSYKPVTDENYYYVKLGYDYSTATELYLKCGYQREELYISGEALSGTQILAGISCTF